MPSIQQSLPVPIAVAVPAFLASPRPSAGGAGAPADVLDLRLPPPPAAVTAEAGDRLSLRDLLETSGARDAALWRVALREDPAGPAGARLILDGAAVEAGRTDFTPEEFNRLQVEAGPLGNRAEVVALARTGTAAADGTLSRIADSAPVQLALSSTGTRSLDAAAALRTSTDPAGDLERLAQQAATSETATRPRPTLTTLGNLTAAAGDTLALRDLVAATPGQGGDAVALWRVALRDDPSGPGGGRLSLDGVDVEAGRTDFTPEEFNRLRLIAGPEGGATDLIVVARAGAAQADGSLRGVADSRPVLVTAAVTGTRSVNAAAALRLAPAEDPGALIRIAQEAAASETATRARPVVTTSGNFTAATGDGFALRDLFDAGPDAFDGVALWRVALRDDPAGPGGGRLELDGAAVDPGRTDFTAEEFNRLRFVAGADGARTEILAVARAGTATADGGLTRIADSVPLSITAAVIGTRSVNAAGALRTPAGPALDPGMRLAQEAATSATATRPRPALGTIGNVEVAAADTLALRDLFDAGRAGGGEVALWRVALREDAGGARLVLDGADVAADRTDFTPEEFNRLQLVAGAEGTRAGLVVVARAGTATADGGLTRIADSAALEITAAVTGRRSVNAAPALRLPAGETLEDALRIAQEAAASVTATRPRPGIGTIGDVTTLAGDALAVRDLFRADGGFDAVAVWRLALRDDPAGSGGGRFVLDGADVAAGRTDFTPEEFNRLQFLAGADGSRTEIVAVGRAGTRAADGTLSGIADSPALRILASATGQRSVNAAGAFRLAAGESLEDALRIAQEAAASETATRARPVVLARPGPAAPEVALDQLAQALGTWRIGGATPGSGPPGVDLALLYPEALAGVRLGGGGIGPGREAALAAALLLGGYGTGGGFAAADPRGATAVALAAYAEAARRG